MILICNSQSRIHPKLRKRLLRIRYDPPNRKENESCVEEITRGDLRFASKDAYIRKRLVSYIHAHPEELAQLVRSSDTDYTAILSEILLLANAFHILDEDLLAQVNATYTFLADSTFSDSLLQTNTLKTLQLFRQKFESEIPICM